MQLQRFTDGTAFFQRVAPFLLAREAEHCLILGLCGHISRHPERFVDPYLGLVEQDGAVVAVALRTPPFNLTLSHTDMPEALRLFVADLFGATPELSGVHGPSHLSRIFADEWQRVSGQAVQPGRHERVFQLERVQPVTSVSGQLRQLTEADIPLLAKWIEAFDVEALGSSGRQPHEIEVLRDRYVNSDNRTMYFWEDADKVVSMAGCGNPTLNGIRVGPVYTPPDQRGKGYASALAAAVSQLQLDNGRRFCTLFTDLSNPTSNHIYQTIGYQPVSDMDEYTFAIVPS
jgi:predicted GNAT family acetyltransferase